MNILTEITSGLTVIAGAVLADSATPIVSAIEPVAQYAGLLEKFGVMACLLLYFLIRDYYRTKAESAEKLALIKKYDALDEFIHTEMMKKLDENTIVINTNERTHRRLIYTLENKAPCLQEAAKELRIQAAKKDT